MCGYCRRDLATPLKKQASAVRRQVALAKVGNPRVLTLMHLSIFQFVVAGLCILASCHCRSCMCLWVCKR